MRAWLVLMFVGILVEVLVISAFAGCAPANEPRAALDDASAAALRSQCAFSAGTRAGLTVAATAPIDGELPFDTIVLVLVQGRSFDHLLATMHGDVDGRMPVGGHATRYCVEDPGDDWKRSHVAFAGGAADAFAAAAATADDPSGARVMQSYSADDLPVLHALAERFAVSDRHFAAMLADADANRAMLYAGTTHGRIDASADTPTAVVAADAPSLFSRLDDAGISWAVYGEGSGPAALAPIRAQHPGRFGGSFGTDALAGTLPHVSFMEVAPPSRGGGRFDFRAPGDVQLGDRMLAELYRDIAASPQWPRMAVFITFLDGGGFYDHVPPPSACRPDAWGPGPGRDELPFTFDQDGFRVPLILVSPWARVGGVSHATSDHASLTRLIEARFGLPALTARDANADPLLDLFDFASPPRTAPAMPHPALDTDELDRCIETY